MDTNIPKLRTDLEIIPVSYQGHKAFIVKDALGLIENPVLLQGDVLELVGLIDGRKSIRDIQLELTRLRKGLLASSNEVVQILGDLDSLCLLESAHYQSKRGRIMSEYAGLSVRPAALAGKSYPESRDELMEFITVLMQREGECEPPRRSDKRVRALVAPHIDLAVGRKAYACAYGAIREMAPEHIVLLGTGHSLSEHFFSLTDKDYETPLGVVKTDREWVETLRQVESPALAPDDFAHRYEHSIEFQLIFLQYLFGSAFTLLPILCGSFQDSLSAFDHPDDIPPVHNFLRSIKHRIDENPVKTLIVAGVDFSHVGPKFGHNRQASALLPAAKNHDKALIDAVCQGNARRFWAEVKRIDNQYNVCGFSSLACLLALLPEAKGACLDYTFWEEEATRSAVS
ncbi:MAG: AmmeMemoRadiSam system protein B, partial [Candidatus Aminicenantes bacterium]|nr:AmmeMemoRadiSam system protein B [Candidatus Aminicenantes bacterium]